MSKLQLFNVFVTERLSTAAVEIFVAAEKTIAEYQEQICRSAEEIERLRRLLGMVFQPEIKLHEADFQLVTPAVPPENQNCEQEWGPSLGQDDPEPTHIKEEQQELRLIQEDPPQPSYPYQNQTVDDGERSSLPIIITEEIKTEADGEGYRVPEPTSDQPLSVHPDCSAAGEKLYQCRQCGKSFTSKGNLTLHLKIHTGEKPFLCKQCGKSFIQKGDLNRHTRVHTGEKPYLCKQCGKSFLQKRDLTIHTRIHTGENPYECKQCGKMFNQKGHLTVHSRIHTGERPYQCKDCGKAFNQKIELTLHMRAHTGERPYICPVCRKSYIALTYLRLHQRVHTGQKPYQCKECDKCFGYKHRLTSHMSTHTKGHKLYYYTECNNSLK
ncbi:zinc finger protein 239-like [Salvelinus fontinalis]|uniref:zinc finger protein 239-like n=1 Tax=Salvelinus fontinalis TaxID=8038 RepID=UPI002486C51E|nr:zinc finger protein 239-like [Salvelinus fontinalis]